MAFVTLYDTDEFAVCQGDVIKKSVSLVISLIDDFTQKEPIGPLKVTINEGNIKPIKNLSGYYVFTGLTDFVYTVKVTPGSATSELYFSPEDERIILPKFDGKGPAFGATTAILKDVSKLQKGDIIVFLNQEGKVDKKEITGVDTGTREISWAGGLRYSFDAPNDDILAHKNLPYTIYLKPTPSYPFSNHTTLVRGLLEDSSGNPVAEAIVKVASQSIETKSNKKGEFVLYFNEIKNEEEISIDIKKGEKSIKPVNTEDLEKITLREGITNPLLKIILNEN